MKLSTIIFAAMGSLGILFFSLASRVVGVEKTTGSDQGPSGGVLGRPVPIASNWTRDKMDLPSLEVDRWNRIVAKFLPDRPIERVADLLHQLETWGVDSQFPRSEAAMSGRRMMSILLDGSRDPLYHPKDPLIYRDLGGRPHLSKSGDLASESHPCQTLATCAALGLPSDVAFRSGPVSATITELILATRDNFHLEGEIEWVAMALARYAPTRDSWTNRRGRSFNFDAVASRLMERPLGIGSCSGTHVLQALTILLRVDALHPLFSDESRSQVRGYLAGASRRLEESQRRDGYWGPDWAFLLADPAATRFDTELFGQAELVLATGHHLEWLALAPVDLCISPQSRRRAIEWSIRPLEAATAAQVRDKICPYSHCFRFIRRYVAPRQNKG